MASTRRQDRKRRKRRIRLPRYCCRQCLVQSDFVPYGGVCPSCRAVNSAQRRVRVGARLLSKAKDGGTIVRDGQEFTVTVLPPKRPR